MAAGSGGGSARVLVVAGTHGNECNAPWLLRHWQAEPETLERQGLELELVLGNPEAWAARRRYLDQDLNRSFALELLADPARQQREVRRARELLALHGPGGERPCAVALDLHSTTAAMGNALVVYGRRPTDLALAAAIQADLGLPIYLHEADTAQTGFLIERWPCGLVIEVGPVPQGVITAQICRQSQLALDAALGALARARAGALRLPVGLTVHRHLGSLDLPRGADGAPEACLHPLRQHRDWVPIRPGDPMFSSADGRPVPYQPACDGVDERLWPVFINEAAYGEKGIALSLTRRERWPCERAWATALVELLAD
ncbi:aspartoacylase [Cyanobium sp. Morenito 9A2]|uniref:aspartoacylase n=1 Tax=Cyanobium sp. Morenito 9A2 TaxID=2823718 RepID=UPI0020CC5C7B|nr:aspartoacylase [Cyanobium sp. Morenito 9A2]MCP9850864.1 aspartoacylase [Cyanobium sp. Morenito 9A2]